MRDRVRKIPTSTWKHGIRLGDALKSSATGVHPLKADPELFRGRRCLRRVALLHENPVMTRKRRDLYEAPPLSLRRTEKQAFLAKKLCSHFGVDILLIREAWFLKKRRWKTTREIYDRKTNAFSRWKCKFRRIRRAAGSAARATKTFTKTGKLNLDLSYRKTREPDSGYALILNKTFRYLR